MDKETLRMQMLAGVITESEYKAKLQENIHDLTPFHKGSHSTGRPDFNKMTADEIEDYLEKDKDNPGGLYGRSLSIVKHILDKKRKEETEKNSLNEHAIGGIVGIGAINQIPPRAKTDYEDAFEYFLSQKYTLNEAEGDVMVDSMALASYIDKLVSLADDMEYTPDMIKGLQDLKAGLSGGEMSVENALDIIKQTIDITRDDIDAVEALGQAVDYDDAIVAKAREIAGLG
jgi:hypothetical protein